MTIRSVPCTANQMMVARLQERGYVSNIPLLLRARGRLHIDCLRDALQLVVDRHDILRAYFSRRASLVYTPVFGVAIDFPVKDVSDAADPLAAAFQDIAERGQRGFSLGELPRIRTRLFELGSDDHLVGLIVDHLVADGVSLGIVAAEWRSFYQAIVARTPFDVPPIAPQYCDFALWQDLWLKSGEAELQRRFWVDQLARLPSRTVTIGNACKAELLAFELDAEARRSLSSLCVRLRIKPFAAVLAVYALLLFVVTGEHDLVIGTVRANRRRPQANMVVGHFANLIPLRLLVVERQALDAFVREVAAVCNAAYAHDELPFPELAAAVSARQGIPAARLAEFSINFVPFPDEAVSWGDGLRMNQIWGLISDRARATSRVTLFIRQQNSGIGGTLVYDPGTINPLWSARFAARFGATLIRLARDGATSVETMLAALE